MDTTQAFFFLRTESSQIFNNTFVSKLSYLKIQEKNILRVKDGKNFPNYWNLMTLMISSFSYYVVLKKMPKRLWYFYYF